MDKVVRVPIYSYSHQRHSKMEAIGFTNLVRSVSRAVSRENARSGRTKVVAVYEVYWTPQSVQRTDGADGSFLRDAVFARDAIMEFSRTHPQFHMYTDIETMPTQSMERVLKCSFAGVHEEHELLDWHSVTEFLRHDVRVYFRDFAVRSHPAPSSQVLEWGTHHVEMTSRSLLKSYGVDPDGIVFEPHHVEL